MPAKNEYWFHVSQNGKVYYYKRNRSGHVNRISQDAFTSATTEHTRSPVYWFTASPNKIVYKKIIRGVVTDVTPNMFHRYVVENKDDIRKIIALINMHHASSSRTNPTHRIVLSQVSMLYNKYILSRGTSLAAQRNMLNSVVFVAKSGSTLTDTPNTFKCDDVILRDDTKKNVFQDANAFIACHGASDCKYVLQRVNTFDEALHANMLCLFAQLANKGVLLPLKDSWVCGAKTTKQAFYLFENDGYETLKQKSAYTSNPKDLEFIRQAISNIFDVAMKNHVFLSGGIAFQEQDFIIHKDNNGNIDDLRLWKTATAACSTDVSAKFVGWKLKEGSAAIKPIDAAAQDVIQRDEIIKRFN